MKLASHLSLLASLSISLSVALALPSARAGDDHNHEASVEPAPRGGVLRDAPPYKSELVLNGDEARIYVYSKVGEKLEPAQLGSTSMEGRLRFPRDKKERSVTFKRAGDAFVARIAGIDKKHRYDLHITLLEAGKRVVLDFGVDNIH